MKIYKVVARGGHALVACKDDTMLTVTEKSITIERGSPILGGAYLECSEQELQEALKSITSKLATWNTKFQSH